MLKYNKKRGFSFMELMVVIAILAILLAVLAPSLLSYVENSRMQKDDSAMEEVVNAVQLAITDSATFDEVYSYCIPNNYVTYTDSSGKYANRTMDEEFWAPDGSGAAVTITFNPENGKYNISEGIVNDMTFGNGSVAEKRTAEGVQQCYLYEMGKSLLYSNVKQTIGDSVKERSATYKNSSYTVFIRFKIVDGTRQADVYGLFNGTNLSEGCPAAIGSNTSSYDAENKPISTTPSGGHQNSKFTNTDLMGGGSFGSSRPLPTYRQCKKGHTFDETNPVLIERCVCTVCYVTEHKLFEKDPKFRCERCEIYIEPHTCNGDICSKCHAFTIKEYNRDKVGFQNVPDEVLTIPDTFFDAGGQKYWVTRIGNNAFYNCTELKQVIVPDSVTEIAEYAFESCTKLQTINIPDGVTYLGYETFMNSGLISITLPSTIKAISHASLYNCPNLKYIAFMGTVEQFRSIMIATNIWIHAGTSIVHCSDGCLSVGRQPVECAIHSGLDSGYAEFADGTTLSWPELYMPDNQSKYGYNIGEQCNIVASNAFKGNKNLVKIVIPAGVTKIGAYAFCGCSKLTSAVLPEGITVMEFETFMSTGLTSINIPVSVESFEHATLYSCPQLKNITYSGTVEQLRQIQNNGYNGIWTSGTKTIHCTNGCVNTSFNPVTCSQHPNP